MRRLTSRANAGAVVVLHEKVGILIPILSRSLFTGTLGRAALELIGQIVLDFEQLADGLERNAAARGTVKLWAKYRLSLVLAFATCLV